MPPDLFPEPCPGGLLSCAGVLLSRTGSPAFALLSVPPLPPALCTLTPALPLRDILSRDFCPLAPVLLPLSRFPAPANPLSRSFEPKFLCLPLSVPEAEPLCRLPAPVWLPAGNPEPRLSAVLRSPTPTPVPLPSAALRPPDANPVPRLSAPARLSSYSLLCACGPRCTYPVRPAPPKRSLSPFG